MNHSKDESSHCSNYQTEDNQSNTGEEEPHIPTTPRQKSMTDNSWTSSTAKMVTFLEHILLFCYEINFFYMKFIKPWEQMEYEEFRIASSSPIYLTVVSFSSVLLFVIYWLIVFAITPSYYAIVICCFSFLCLLTMWVITSFRWLIPLQKQQYSMKSFFIFIESLTMVGYSVSLGVFLLFRSLFPCPMDFSFARKWLCISSKSCSTIPYDLTILLMILPLIYSGIFPFPSMHITLLCCVIDILFVLIAFSFCNIIRGIPFLLLGITVAIITVYSRFQNMELFYSVTQYYKMESERKEEKLRLIKTADDEMKNLIHWITHDLKSVSS
jgi:hypothetical protein